MAGTLYVCATPIGNMADVTLRALDVLRQVHVIAAEDTRRTRKLLSHYDIRASLVSYHEHNKAQAGQRILDMLLDGRDVALVSDSGMPAISDPGEDLVSAVVQNGLRVEVVPGPSAALTALVLSGLSTDRFAFEGFLPRKGQDRIEALEQLEHEVRTIIIYESPQRVIKTLEDLGERVGKDRRCSLSRELTKRFEETIRGTVGSLLESFSSRDVRGECVLVVEGAERSDQGAGTQHMSAMRPELEEMVRVYADKLVSAGASRRDAAVTISEALGCPWRQIYRLIAADKSTAG